MGNGEREPKSIESEIAEMRVELKWTKWLAAAAFAASTLGQLGNLTPFTPQPSVIVDLLGRLL